MKLTKKFISLQKDDIHRNFTVFGVKIKTLRRHHIKSVYIPRLQNEIKKLKSENSTLSTKISKFENTIKVLKGNIEKREKIEKLFKQQRKEFQHYIVEHNLYNLLYKLIPHSANEMRIEVNLADHCNLNCKFCDHFSPIAEEYYLDTESYENDIKRLSQLTNGILGGLSLVGGEPLLNKNICDFLKISRQYFPNTLIDIVTNGILLNKNKKIWEALKTYNIKLYVTTYPIKIDFNKIDKLAEEFDIKYERFYMFGTNAIEKVSVHHPFKIEGDVNPNDYIQCYHFNRCITLRHGKIYTCPIIPYSEHFNKYFKQNLEKDSTDAIDIYKAKDFKEIAEFCATRPNFCKYCDVIHRKPYPYGISKKDISEWT